MERGLIATAFATMLLFSGVGIPNRRAFAGADFASLTNATTIQVASFNSKLGGVSSTTSDCIGDMLANWDIDKWRGTIDGGASFRRRGLDDAPDQS